MLRPVKTIGSLTGWFFAGWSSDRTLIGARVAPDGTLVLEGVRPRDQDHLCIDLVP